MVLALSSESEHDKVENFIENNGYTVRTASGSTAGSQKYGVKGIPHSVLVGSDGTILWRGSPGGLSTGKIKEALKGARKPSEGGYLSFRPTVTETKAIAGALKYINDGKLGKALASAQAVAENESSDPSDVETATQLVGQIEAHADLILSQAQQALDAYNVVVAMEVYETIEKELKGTDRAKQAADALERIEDSDKLQEELAASKAFEKVKKSAGRLSTSKKKKKYEEFAKKYAGTRAADKAMSFVRAS